MKLKLKDLVCDLANTQLSVVRTSPYPMMASGLTGGNFVFNFTLPATPELKATLKHAHKPHSFVSVVEVPYELKALGISFSGTAQVAEASEFEYEVFCPVENGDFNAQAKNIKLKELNLGGDVILSASAMAKAMRDESLFINESSDIYYEYNQVLPFPTITINTGGLNAPGTIYTASTAQAHTIAFYIECNLIAYLVELRLFKNNVLVDHKTLHNIRNRFSFDLDLLPTDQISWKLFIEPLGDDEGNFIIDGAILPGATIDIVRTHMDAQILAAAQQRYPDQNFAVFPIENPLVFDKWPDDFYQIDNESVKLLYAEYFKVINYFVDGNFPATMTTQRDEDSYMAGNLFVPFPYIAYLVKRIAYHFNFAIQNNVFESELKYAVLINHFVENQFLANDAKMLAPSDSFNLANHVPDWTIYDFLKHLCNLFGLGYEVNNDSNVITFNFVDDILASNDYIDISEMVIERPVVLFNKKITGYNLKLKPPTNDKYFDEVKSMEGLNVIGTVDLLSELPATAQLNDCYFVNFVNAYMVWGYDENAYVFGWVFHSRKFTSEIGSGTDQQEVSTELCPLLEVIKGDSVNPTSGRSWSIPASHQPGKFEGAPDTFQTDWQPGVVWYHGMKNDSDGRPYPFASAGITDHAGNTISGATLALTLDGSNGLFEKKWKTYLEWRLATKPVRVLIQPTAGFLRAFSFAKKVRFNGSNYLVAEMRGNILHTGPGTFELTLLIT